MRTGVRIGVDVGDVRIGVARSDPAGSLAVPVEVVARGPGDVARIAALVHEYEAIELIVGLPLSMSGREGPAAAKVRAFVADLITGLAAGTGLESVVVRLVDERLSTVAATRGMRAGGTSVAKGRQRVDAAAAAVIVQTALDRERATGVPAGDIVARQSIGSFIGGRGTGHTDSAETS
jgi:putative Holliday junction resolvase